MTSGELGNRLKLHRQEQEMSDHAPSRAPHSLGLHTRAKPQVHSAPASISLAGQQAVFVQVLFQNPHPIDWTMQCTSAPLPPNPPIPPQPQRNSETQAASTQRRPRGRLYPTLSSHQLEPVSYKSHSAPKPSYPLQSPRNPEA